MKTITKVMLSFLIMSLITVLLYNVVYDFKNKQIFDEQNGLCITITNEMKKTMDENSSCIDYYCYYARYAPPPGYENKTDTLCVCDCKTKNNTIVTTQVLSSGSAPINNIKMK
jgi:hypothetical protein